MRFRAYWSVAIGLWIFSACSSGFNSTTGPVGGAGDSAEPNDPTVTILVPDAPPALPPGPDDSCVENSWATLGADITAIPGQSVTVIAFLKFNSALVSDLEFALGLDVPVEEGEFEVSVDPTFTAQKSFRFTVPADAPTGVNYPLSLIVTAMDGSVHCDGSTLLIEEQDDVGNEDFYSWDLQLFADYTQPVDAIPLVSVFDVDGTKTIMDQYFPSGFAEVPYPILLQPFESASNIGIHDLTLTCDFTMPDGTPFLNVGQGYCIAFEDWLDPASDLDYDLLFFSRVEKKKLSFLMTRITNISAKNKTQVRLTDVAESVKSATVTIKRRSPGETEFSILQSWSQTVNDQAATIVFWETIQTAMPVDNTSVIVEIELLE